MESIFHKVLAILPIVIIVAGIVTLAIDCEAKDYSAYRDECAPIRRDVENILSAVGINPDYFYLLVAESHCQNKTSKAGAKGMWQMMPATARKYGCNEPEDLECETWAAAKYLKHLEEKCGEENVIYCWHDGGSNFLRKGEATQAAKGLRWQFYHLQRTDLPDTGEYDE